MTDPSLTLQRLEDEGIGRVVRGDAQVSLRGVRHDSREIEPGELFVAMPGFSTDGARFSKDAITRGAVAIALETPLDLDVPQLEVRDARRALGPIASAVYGHPTRSLSVIGMTGTNGKTTTTWLLDGALVRLGARPSLMGTIETRGPAGRERAGFTTPEADAIARFARRNLDAGSTHLVMEVSSHALALHRADAIAFDVAAFSNLSQDHLDFHETMDAYFDAKARLFTELLPRNAVINVDDPAGERLASRIDPAIEVLRVSRSRDDADLRAHDVSFSRGGIEATLSFRGSRARLVSPMLGAHNLDNHLLAAGCLAALGYGLVDIAAALSIAEGAPGRLERVEGPQDIAILVDYAHTPDALTHALETLRPLTAGRLFVVFGCGGDRDTSKRPLMGRAAADGADVVVVTSDNPRSEDPHAILAAIEPGVRASQEPVASSALATTRRGYTVIEDRAAAIAAAVGAASASDTVLIAGKGHEDYQIRGATKFAFDDRVEARRALAARGQA